MANLRLPFIGSYRGVTATTLLPKVVKDIMVRGGVSKRIAAALTLTIAARQLGQRLCAAVRQMGIGNNIRQNDGSQLLASISGN